MGRHFLTETPGRTEKLFYAIFLSAEETT